MSTHRCAFAIRSEIIEIVIRRARRNANADALLSVLLISPDLDGLQLADRLGIGPTKVWIGLTKLERNGFVAASWDERGAADLRQPRRRLYRLTALGSRA